MFQPYYIKSEYLKRVIYSGVLLVGIFVGAGLLFGTTIGAWISYPCMILLGFCRSSDLI